MTPTVKELRAKTGMSQSQFAAYFGISVRTLQGWELGRPVPEGKLSMMQRIIELEANRETKNP